MSDQPVVTRFAPSPSGELHLGNARTALFNHLLARRHGGRFVLRIEDTDVSRSSEAHIQSLCADLRWLGLDWDVGPGVPGDESQWRQSARGAIYAPCYQRLLASGRAYECFCTSLELEVSRRAQLAAGRPPRYAGTCRNLTAAQRAGRIASGLRPTLRFAVPAGEVVGFDDLVHGTQHFRSDEIGDFIIRREDGSSAFFFCNAIDDATMGVSHVLRGEDHLSNTPRQLLLLAALGLAAPRYAHVSLLTGADGAPLSKRHGATSLRELREQGFAPAAIVNLLFRLGHSTPLNGLLLPAPMADAFDTGHLQSASAHFDLVQLRHWQSEWVHTLPRDQAREWLAPWLPADLAGPAMDAFLDAVMPNTVLAADARDWAEVLYREPVRIDVDARAAIDEAGSEFFAAAATAVAVAREVDVASLRAATGRKGVAFFKPLRAALTGRLHGPEIAPLLRAMPHALVRTRLLAHSGASH
jgi:glutamyl-tRNA synthetase